MLREVPVRRALRMSCGPFRKLENCVSMMDTLLARATGITLAIPCCCLLGSAPASHRQPSVLPHSSEMQIPARSKTSPLDSKTVA